jgi:hypothetical protein
MRARFAREIKLLLIYELHFQTADCLGKRARACRDGRLSELLGGAFCLSKYLLLHLNDIGIIILGVI